MQPDRTMDNQFPNTLDPEQLRHLQNLAALSAQGLLGSNLNLLNPIALQNLLNPILNSQVNNQPPNGQQQQQTRSSLLSNPASQQQQSSQKKQPKKQRVDQSSPTVNIGPRVGSIGATSGVGGAHSSNRPLVALLDGRDCTVELPIHKDVATVAPSGSGMDNQRLQLQQTIRLLKAQQQQQQQQQQQHQQQLIQNEITQRLQQQLQQIVQHSQRQQQPPSHPNSIGDSTSLSVRQQSLQDTLQSVPTGVGPGTQKRKRGRPPLSAPSTSAASSSAVDYSFLNMVSAVKIQQDRERMQRESKILQDRQREMRLQQERERQRELKLAQERAERQRELRAQQERERQRMELERQRKAQHRLALQDIDRERRRQHMNMVRNLDAYKRNEEREKTMNAMMLERNKQLERRIHQKRLETELIKDIRKPIDDMMLKNQKPLATLNRIPGLKLPGKAFADLLMSYEFLFNFGETVGLAVNDIPDINTLQLALLNLNNWAEDMFIGILYHLCMFAIKDPRFPYTGSTKEIESLEQTNEGLSQLLHFYLQVLTLNSKTEMEHEVRLYKLIEQKYFLSLNATQKAEMFAFICNELLCSQTVTKQMEDTIENVAKLRKDKWVLENELRKYRAIKTKRDLKEEAEQRAKEANATNGDSERSEDDKLTDSKINDIKKNEDERAGKSNMTNGSSLIDNTLSRRENEADTSNQPNNTGDLDDLEPGMTNDELSKKIENLTRLYNKTSNKLEKAINSMRACPLGQDRFRRRYWVLPQVGGVFVEGMESSEPEELENNKFTDEELQEYEKEQQVLDALNSDNAPTAEDLDKVEIKAEKEDEDMDIKDEPVDVKEDDEPIDVNDDVENSELKEHSKVEPTENGVSEGDKTTADSNCDEVSSLPMPSIPWFSILPRVTCDFFKPVVQELDNIEAVDNQKKVREEETVENKELSSEELRSMRHEICPALARRLEELEAEQYETPRKIHPQFQCGWWRITDAQQLKSILSVLHERGSRERILHKHLTKHFQYACNSCKNSNVDFEITSYDRQLAGKNYGAPMPHTDEDSADDLKEGEEEEEEEEDAEEFEDEPGDDKTIQQAAAMPSRKPKRKKTSRSARSRRLRARAAARKKVENSKNKIAQR